MTRAHLSVLVLVLLNAAIALTVARAGRQYHWRVATSIFGAALGVSALEVFSFAMFGVVGLIACSIMLGLALLTQGDS